jgi:hypothetical protein
MLSMTMFVKQTVRSDKAAAAENLRKSAVMMKHEYPLLERLSAKECEGDRRVRMLLEALAYIDKVMFRRSKQQKQIHYAMLVLSLESYYGEELQENLVRLLKKHKISELRTEGLFMAPRRFGKTIAISIFVGCELVTQPGNSTNYLGHDVLVYSNNQRASALVLMNTFRVTMALIANPKFGGTLGNLEKRGSMSIVTREGYTNMLTALPADEERLRGVGSRAVSSTVIGEEIGYMPPGIVFKIIAPILTRRRVKFVGITTVKGDGDSFLMPLANAKYPDGRSIMLTLNFDLVCDDCKRRGLALQCKCLASEIPAWQSSARHDKLQHLMKDNPTILLTEIKNVPLDEMISRAFKFEAVDWLRSEAAVLKERDVFAPIIYTTVDPACGGHYSRFAIISCIWYNQCFVVSSHACEQCILHRAHVFFGRQSLALRLQLLECRAERQHCVGLCCTVRRPALRARGLARLGHRHHCTNRGKKHHAGEEELLRHGNVVGELADAGAAHELVNAAVQRQHPPVALVGLSALNVLHHLLDAPAQFGALLKGPGAVKKARADLPLPRRPVCHLDLDGHRALAHVVAYLGFALGAPFKRNRHWHRVVSAAPSAFVETLLHIRRQNRVKQRLLTTHSCLRRLSAPTRTSASGPKRRRSDS